VLQRRSTALHKRFVTPQQGTFAATESRHFRLTDGDRRRCDGTSHGPQLSCCRIYKPARLRVWNHCRPSLARASHLVTVRSERHKVIAQSTAKATPVLRIHLDVRAPSVSTILSAPQRSDAIQTDASLPLRLWPELEIALLQRWARANKCRNFNASALWRIAIPSATYDGHTRRAMFGATWQ